MFILARGASLGDLRSRLWAMASGQPVLRCRPPGRIVRPPLVCAAKTLRRGSARVVAHAVSCWRRRQDGPATRQGQAGAAVRMAPRRGRGRPRKDMPLGASRLGSLGHDMATVLKVCVFWCGRVVDMVDQWWREGRGGEEGRPGEWRGRMGRWQWAGWTGAPAGRVESGVEWRESGSWQWVGGHLGQGHNV